MVKFRVFIPYFAKVSAIALFCFLFKNNLNDLYQAIYDSYIGIGMFVASSLLVIYFFEHYTKNAMIRFLTKHQKLQVPVATFLGVLPGCGGAIIVVTNYSRGYVTFGSMVATLVATMGDAAILLIQKKPQMALLLFIIVSITGIIVGYLVDFLSKEKFAKPKEGTSLIPARKSTIPHFVSYFWIGLLGVNAIFYFFPSLVREITIQSFAIIGILSTLFLWIFKNPNHSCTQSSCIACSDTFSKVVIESGFIISWILIGILTYQSIFLLTQFDISKFVQTNIYYIPFVAAVIGLIPGCGPQIVITTFYVNGAVPFAAQISNAISNDGDALMPAIAMQPKKAIIATAYSFIPALIVGYIILFVMM